MAQKKSLKYNDQNFLQEIDPSEFPPELRVYIDQVKHDSYNQAIKDFNTAKMVIVKQWNPSICPTCEHDFGEYEHCYDGFYDRCTNLERCPYCGQKICWPVQFKC